MTRAAWPVVTAWPCSPAVLAYRAAFGVGLGLQSSGPRVQVPGGTTGARVRALGVLNLVAAGWRVPLAPDLLAAVATVERDAGRAAVGADFVQAVRAADLAEWGAL